MKGYRLILNHAEMVDAGKRVAGSRMFGEINPDSGYMIVSICQAAGMTFLEFNETYNWMHNSAHMKADAILARFCDMGGKYTIEERTSERAAIKLEYGEKIEHFAITWEEIQKEPWTKDKYKETKTNYATPYKRMQSLWSRVSSDGVHTVCPQACKGAYPVEEAETFVNEDLPRATAPPVPLSAAQVKAMMPEPEPNTVTDANAIDYTVCPTLGSEYDGKPWTEFSAEILRRVIESDKVIYPEITDTHLAAIKLVLRDREEVEKGGGE